jgi:hypothetical protein
MGKFREFRRFEDAFAALAREDFTPVPRFCSNFLADSKEGMLITESSEPQKLDA